MTVIKMKVIKMSQIKESLTCVIKVILALINSIKLFVEFLDDLKSVCKVKNLSSFIPASL